MLAVIQGHARERGESATTSTPNCARLRMSGTIGASCFTIHVAQSGITVDLEIEPETLNRTSNGNWVMAEIELPHGYRAADVDISSIWLEGTVPAAAWPYERRSRHRDDGCDADRAEHDHGGIKVKFARAAVIGLLPAGERVPVHVTGTVAGVPFEGLDVIRVIK